MLLLLFVIVGSVTFLSVGYRIVTDLLLRKQVLSGRASAAELLAYLGMESLEELDDLRDAEPTLLKVLPGAAGPYEEVEFSFSPRRVRPYRRSTLQARLQSIPVHLTALTLIAIAMAANHERVLGWIALMAAFFVELLRLALPQALARSRRPAPSATVTTTVRLPGDPETSYGEPVDEYEAAALSDADGPVAASSGDGHAAAADGDDAVAAGAVAAADSASPADPAARSDESDRADPQPADAAVTPSTITATPAVEVPSNDAERAEEDPQFETCVLLRTYWRPVATVVNASLRRAGRRDAVVAPQQPDDGSAVIHAGTTRLRISPVDTAIEPRLITYAASQSWDWPEAAERAADHTAYLTVSTPLSPEVDRAETIALHLQVHAALTEFAPVVAALWPHAGRLVPGEGLVEGASATPLSACVNFRAFPLEGGGVASDTVGLHAFGLPDVQAVTDTVEPDESVARSLYELAERMLSGGGVVADAEIVEAGGSRWSVHHAESRFPPARKVIELAAAEDEAATPMQEQETSPEPASGPEA